MSSATRPRPMVAAVKDRALPGRSPEVAKPRVRSDEPLRRKAWRGKLLPNAQNIGVNATSIATIHTAGRMMSATGA